MSSTQKLLWRVLLIVVVVALAVLVDLPHGPNLRLGGFTRELKLHLGLDLQGGAHLVYDADVSQVPEADRASSLAALRDVIERRVNAFGVAEPLVQTNTTANASRLIVELAGIKDVNVAIKQIGQTPFLEFREQAAQGDPSADQYGFKPSGLSGKQLDRAEVQFDQQSGLPNIGLTFDDEGKKLFGEITQRNLGKPLAIFLDGQVLSAPTVQSAITDGRAVITGQFTVKEAQELARNLTAGALPVPITLVSQNTVGATLGAESIQRSIIAGVIGLFLVALFMILYYRLPGLIAVIALGIYSTIVLAIFKLVPVTLTLAGIAGFILSIGMAVDANVLIFERLKEELRRGVSLTQAVQDGFRHAWLSIRDSNSSSILSALILSWFGTSIIKGFALTLIIGILVSLFTAITASKTMLDIVTRWRVFRKPWWYGASAQSIVTTSSEVSA